TAVAAPPGPRSLGSLDRRYPGPGEDGQIGRGDRSSLGNEERRQVGPRGALARVEAAMHRAAGADGRVRVEDDAAGHRLPPAGLAQDEPVVDVEDQRIGNSDAGEASLRVRQLAGFVEPDPRPSFG